ncbi:alpha-isopropylmalate synthase regulatory domain-containing protein [Streptomyces sp. DSM 15324]|uniref:alpha-isopropylmalate synthase regulatory domain-containing protein n=1 Tax=Streptomyces sp. DSM 15324 TaxID=1739111 RepID=UPI00099E8843|nr:alpha-isopropylmalate synthase regulatory domain-containing protein [Streptomyces sp. DSM 15324]
MRTVPIPDFRTTYISPALDSPVTLAAWNTTEPVPGEHRFTCTLHADGQEHSCQGTGNGPLSALADALGTVGITVDILSSIEHSTATVPGSPAVAYAECRVGDGTCWGAGWDTSILTASVHAAPLSHRRRAGHRRSRPYRLPDPGQPGRLLHVLQTSLCLMRQIWAVIGVSRRISSSRSRRSCVIESVFLRS